MLGNDRPYVRESDPGRAFSPVGLSTFVSASIAVNRFRTVRSSDEGECVPDHIRATVSTEGCLLLVGRPGPWLTNKRLLGLISPGRDGVSTIVDEAAVKTALANGALVGVGEIGVLGRLLIDDKEVGDDAGSFFSVSTVGLTR